MNRDLQRERARLFFGVVVTLPLGQLAIGSCNTDTVECVPRKSSLLQRLTNPFFEPRASNYRGMRNLPWYIYTQDQLFRSAKSEPNDSGVEENPVATGGEETRSKLRVLRESNGPNTCVIDCGVAHQLHNNGQLGDERTRARPPSAGAYVRILERT